MAIHRLLTFIAAGLVSITAAAQERGPLGSPATPAAPAAAAPSSPSAATPALRTAPSEPMRANADAPPTPATADPRRAPPLAIMGAGSFGGVSATTSPTLEGAMGSGARIPGTRAVRKVCPPGLENRDGNCAPPIEGIMRP
jgi:hypothetical protein